MLEPEKLLRLRTEASSLMQQHKLYEWTFQLDGAKARLGYCNPSRKLISMSYKLSYANTEAQNTNTLLHEIAHALTIGEHHNEIWKAKCIEIGGDGERLGKETELKLDSTPALWDNGGEIPETYRELWKLNEPKWTSKYNRALINLDKWKRLSTKAEKMEKKYHKIVRYYQKRYELS